MGNILVLATTLLCGCASDPLTATLKKYGYAPVIPLSSKMNIGDIYETKGLTQPYLLMGDILKEDIQAIMDELGDDVSIPEESMEKRFEVSGEADLVDMVSSELAIHDIKKFRIRLSGVVQYKISKVRFEEQIYSKIKEKYPDRDFDKKYVIIALLKVNGIEYEFFDNKGGKVSVAPNGEIEKILKAKLGSEWSASENNTLKINDARFIGYRMAQLNKISYGTVRTKTQEQIELKEIPPEELRRLLK